MDRHTTPRVRSKRTLTVTLLAGGLLVGGLTGLSAADGPPEHPHMLVQRPEIGMTEDGPAVVGFRRCVDLAANQPLRNNAHHDHIHDGHPGDMLTQRAGHVVVPGPPLTEYTNCAVLESKLPILLPPPPDDEEE